MKLETRERDQKKLKKLFKEKKIKNCSKIFDKEKRMNENHKKENRMKISTTKK